MINIILAIVLFQNTVDLIDLIKTKFDNVLFIFSSLTLSVLKNCIQYQLNYMNHASNNVFLIILNKFDFFAKQTVKMQS